MKNLKSFNELKINENKFFEKNSSTIIEILEDFYEEILHYYGEYCKTLYILI